ncbi:MULTISPECIES: branched-chain amino acid ABC transporter permease [unclassified Beijerinckia]|uniref:branched-chain amino acid ABC transporter permease n=1 Tax=unclassified Beijerinckia TaxID=2638183 RepID=UPI0008976419|nr:MULTISPECIES: branched-chain amino acid ABC transporter permease [unclassified Beijerinckia]MDH7796058.1 branched-chain amino acid transport system permease protein [Beijerinckia sp. GAS462]SEC28417.1 amino acid/amide ABC transporter membrane protein 1, HAAT family [Beijerinckia sp. 28-YEA-48]
MSVEFLSNALIAGLLIGCFYAAVTIGISISFGFLDIANIAHPAFVIAGSYATYLLNQGAGIDPLLSGLVLMIPFFLLGCLFYDIYFHAFEQHGREGLSGLAFFFGLMFIIEVVLIMSFGVDFRYVEAGYLNSTLRLGFVDLPMRLLVPSLVAVLLFAGLQVFLSTTFQGRAIIAVSQDPSALSLLSIRPRRIKRLAFGLSVASAGLAGALLIMIQPVEPAIGREYIGRVFAICVLGGMGSLPGTLIAALLLGVIESLTSSYYGPAWAPAVSFTFLLATLTLRPRGLLGR